MSETPASVFGRSVEGPYLEDVQEKLLVDGFCIVSDQAPDLGFDPTFRPHVLATYFGPSGILKPETYDVKPADRLRARGVVGFEYSADGRTVSLHDVSDDSISGKEYHPDERYYELTPLTHDPRFKHYLECLLNLLPRPVAPDPALGYYGTQHMIKEFTQLMLTGSPGMHPINTQQAGGYAEDTRAYFEEFLRLTKTGTRGIIGVNFFEVFNDVVSGFHQDGTHFGIVDRLEHNGGGATSQLRALGAPLGMISMGRTLEPGQKLIFNDRLRAHTATPLTGENRMARTLVSTVDFEAELSARDLERMLDAVQRLTRRRLRNIPPLRDIIEAAGISV